MQTERDIRMRFIIILVLLHMFPPTHLLFIHLGCFGVAEFWRYWLVKSLCSLSKDSRSYFFPCVATSHELHQFMKHDG